MPRYSLLLVQLLVLGIGTPGYADGDNEYCSQFQEKDALPLVYVEGQLLAKNPMPGVPCECMPVPGLAYDIDACQKGCVNPPMRLWLTFAYSQINISSKQGTVPIILYMREQELNALNATLSTDTRYRVCGTINHPDESHEFAVPVIKAIVESLKHVE